MKDLTRITKYVYDLLLAIKSLEEKLLQMKETQEILIAQQAPQIEKMQIIQPTQQITNPDRLIRVSEVCKLLNIDRKTVINWTNKGLLAPKDIAGIDFYWESEVLKFKRY